MITFIARLRLLEGKEEDGLNAAREMVGAVQADEPNTLAYCCHQNAADPLEVVFYEIYADEAAKDAHLATPHFKGLMGLMGQVFDPGFGVKVEDLDAVSLFC
ncbi:MAG TPA: antibiotic biosynthesis monooxygenase, partial [Candidatus Hydrogenedentes bacterium]|nr:antibiotic biosynthesis monooxygenase [Candidatus Hydrogenedentota bacterium]